jgi:hypothetical protein
MQGFKHVKGYAESDAGKRGIATNMFSCLLLMPPSECEVQDAMPLGPWGHRSSPHNWGPYQQWHGNSTVHAPEKERKPPGI